MQGMFWGATSANSATSGWDTSSVTDMSYMFSGAVSFDRDLGAWNVTALLDATSMFDDVALSTWNYDSLLTGWDAQDLNPGVTFSGGDSVYCSSVAAIARSHMIAADSWTITDGGQLCEPGCNYSVAQPAGGESWQSGLTYSVNWHRTGADCAGTASLELYESGSYMQTIATDTSDTTFAWSIPTDQPIGYDYTVKVVDSTEPSYSAASDDPFVINSPYCNVQIMPRLMEYGIGTYEACDVLIVPPTFGAAAGASVRLSSGRDVVIEPDVSVERGAELDLSVCGKSLCDTSPEPMPHGCHTCVERICGYDATCCGLEWDQACVNRVTTDCGLICEP